MPIPEDQDGEVFARSGNSDIFGPLDDEIVIRVNGDIKIELMRRARQQGYPNYSEFLRKLFAVELYGEAHVVSVATKRILGDTANVLRVPGEVCK